MSTPPNVTAVGSVLDDRYELVRLIARGGMGDVYEAEDRQLRRSVAVKVFRAGAAADRARFDSEVVVLAAQNHPGLVQVYDAGEHAGDAYVVLELVNGPTLASRVADGPLLATEVANVGAAIADALAYIHERGVVHRDVTPSNVLCDPDGRPRLADFGIARLVDTSRITATAMTVGTPAYMAPEQVQGNDVTPAADVYALGLVLLELLTGRKGFTGSPHEMAVARLARDPDTSTGVPGAWRPLLAAMTDRAAPNRPTAVDVRDRLAALVESAAASTGVRATVAALPLVVPPPGGQPAVSGDAPTRSLNVIEGGTTVLPVALVPDEGDGASPRWLDRPRRRALVATAVGTFLLVAAAMASGGGELDGPPTTTTVAPVVAVAPTTTTTVAPVAPAPPPKDDEGKGRDKPPKHEQDEDD